MIWSMNRLLVIDDDENIRELLGAFFEEKKLDVAMAEDGQVGLELIKQEKFDIILLDLVMPRVDGMDVLRELAELKNRTPVIVTTAFASVQSAVEAVKLGAFDYITKPFDLEELLIVIERALDVLKLQKENVMLRRQLKRKYDFSMLKGTAPSMQKVYEMIEKIADTDTTVLIEGASGTGKEVIAKTIHFNSARVSGPFVPVNCAAIPKDLLESEMFGHEKGAFTGAINSRAGRFELASGGTIFLDEIGELHPSLQVKLLRVLQEREFERVGGTKTIKVDVRILAATNRDLESATKEGSFREDLFYRLSVIPLHVPPLRDRREDIPLLTDLFMGNFCKKRRKEKLKIQPAAMERVMQYSWPGNVRELENLIERLVILDDKGYVTLEDLPERFLATSAMASGPGLSDISFPGIDLPSEGINLNSVLNEIENSLIIQAMKSVGGVKSKAAAKLKLNRTTLIEKLKKKDLGI